MCSDWEVIELIGTLENRRLQNGDRAVVSLGSGEYEAEIVDSSDQSKVKIRLDSGTELWIGRRAVVELVTED